MKVGLVLSGGAARGLCHTGVLQALNEINVRPDLISGSSAGALVGAMYAAGIQPMEIFEIYSQYKFFSINGFSPFKLGLFQSKTFFKVLEKNIPVRNFEELDIPLFVWTTNIEEGKSKVFHSGKLIPPIAASAAIPLIFQPVVIHNRMHADGGILNNFPVESLLGKCDIIIGSNVSNWPLNQQKWNSKLILQRSFQLTLNAGLEDKKKLCNIFIDPPIGHFNPFGKSKLKELQQMGYNETMRQAEDILKLKNKTTQ